MGKNFAAQLRNIKDTYYREGLLDGETIMADMVVVALNREFGFGNMAPEKWDRLAKAISEINADIRRQIKEGYPELGFEHLVRDLVDIRGEEHRELFEKRYQKVLYNFK